MYSKTEAQAIKKEFWIQFGQTFPRKWLLHNTKIKDVSFKFEIEPRKVAVGFFIECKSDELRKIYYEKIVSLKTILEESYLPEVLYEQHFTLENGKTISKIWVEKQGIKLYNQENWGEIYSFFYDKMEQFEYFFYEYQDYIQDLEINT
jgi:hypothetical protein